MEDYNRSGLEKQNILVIHRDSTSAVNRVYEAIEGIRPFASRCVLY